MLFSRKLVHNWYMASEWIKEKYETRSDHEPRYSKNTDHIDCVTDACQLLEKSIY